MSKTPSNMLSILAQDSYEFPDPESALEDPNGLLAMGGDLHPERIISAYRQGIFPWYEEGQPILWWTPDPRMVLFPRELHVSRSLHKALKKNRFTVTADTDFSAVISACAAKRPYATGTWITRDVMAAYTRLHNLGLAHSIEARLDGELAGGLYGIALGKIFFGESMFSARDNASKVAFYYLVKHLEILGYDLIDCQISSDHLASFGAREISRHRFHQYLPGNRTIKDNAGLWVESWGNSMQHMQQNRQ